MPLCISNTFNILCMSFWNLVVLDSVEKTCATVVESSLNDLVDFLHAILEFGSDTESAAQMCAIIVEL